MMISTGLLRDQWGPSGEMIDMHKGQNMEQRKATTEVTGARIRILDQKRPNSVHRDGIVSSNHPQMLLPSVGIVSGDTASNLLQSAKNAIGNPASVPKFHLAKRLDHNTSSVMVITKSYKVVAKLVKAFIDHRVVEVREDVDKVIVAEEKSLMATDQKDEILVRAFPRSGRTHQIRLHCWYLGTPIKGDVKYEGVYE
ncbi:hypothetical protein Ancab_036103 [Ancistrocladus abbreviatus]